MSETYGSVTSGVELHMIKAGSEKNRRLTTFYKATSLTSIVEAIDVEDDIGQEIKIGLLDKPAKLKAFYKFIENDYQLETTTYRRYDIGDDADKVYGKYFKEKKAPKDREVIITSRTEVGESHGYSVARPERSDTDVYYELVDSRGLAKALIGLPSEDWIRINLVAINPSDEQSDSVKRKLIQLAVFIDLIEPRDRSPEAQAKLLSLLGFLVTILTNMQSGNGRTSKANIDTAGISLAYSDNLDRSISQIYKDRRLLNKLGEGVLEGSRKEIEADELTSVRVESIEVVTEAGRDNLGVFKVKEQSHSGKTVNLTYDGDQLLDALMVAGGEASLLVSQYLEAVKEPEDYVSFTDLMSYDDKYKEQLKTNRQLQESDIDRVRHGLSLLGAMQVYIVIGGGNATKTGYEGYVKPYDILFHFTMKPVYVDGKKTDKTEKVFDGVKILENDKWKATAHKLLHVISEPTLSTMNTPEKRIGLRILSKMAKYPEQTNAGHSVGFKRDELLDGIYPINKDSNRQLNRFNEKALEVGLFDSIELSDGLSKLAGRGAEKIEVFYVPNKNTRQYITSSMRRTEKSRANRINEPYVRKLRNLVVDATNEAELLKDLKITKIQLNQYLSKETKIPAQLVKIMDNLRASKY